MGEYDTITLESLVKMKRVFEEADEDGSGELEPEEFAERLGPYLGAGLSRTQLAQLFMRIDADCGGTIDWEEFTNYFFLQRAATGGADGGADWRLHAQARRRRRGASMQGCPRTYRAPPAQQPACTALCGPAHQQRQPAS